MADVETMVEKHYCYDHPSAYKNNDALLGALLGSNRYNQYDPMTTMAVMNGNNGFGGNWNNPFAYILVMWMMRFMNGGYGDGGFAGGNSYNSRAISQLQSTVDNNHNNDLVMQAIHGNADAIHELAGNLNCDFNTLSQSICGIKSAIEHVSSKVGFSAERVINAVNQGDASIISAIKDCCCQTQQSVQRMGYENQLATERQTGILGSKIDDFKATSQLQNCQQTNTLERSIEDVRQATVSGFSQIGYQMAADKNEIMQNATANTQRIMDLLNNRWYIETSQALQDSKMEVSQLKQTQTIIAALKAPLP